MKVKKFLAISISLLTIVSGVLLFYPIIHEEYRRDSLNSNPLNPGTVFKYSFYAYAIYTKQLYQTHQQFTCTDTSNGTLTIEVNPNSTISVSVTETSVVPGHMGNYGFKGYLSSNNCLIKYFLNNVSLSSPFIQINSLVGKVSSSQHIFCYHRDRWGQGLCSDCWTLPTDLNIINIHTCGMNTSETSYSDNFPNRLCYDQSGGGYNILTYASLNGNFSLAKTLFPNSDVFLAQGLSINLLKTNAGLHPLVKEYYISIYASYVLFIWVLSAPVIYSVIYSARKRSNGRRGLK